MWVLVIILLDFIVRGLYSYSGEGEVHNYITNEDILVYQFICSIYVKRQVTILITRLQYRKFPLPTFFSFITFTAGGSSGREEDTRTNSIPN